MARSYDDPLPPMVSLAYSSSQLASNTKNIQQTIEYLRQQSDFPLHHVPVADGFAPDTGDGNRVADTQDMDCQQTPMVISFLRTLSSSLIRKTNSQSAKLYVNTVASLQDGFSLQPS